MFFAVDVSVSKNDANALLVVLLNVVLVSLGLLSNVLEGVILRLALIRRLCM